MSVVLLAVGCTGCANFRRLGEDLKFIEKTHIITATIDNASRYPRVYGVTVDWDREAGKIDSADFSEIGDMGIFGFFVEGTERHYLMAFSDSDDDGRYDEGEPAWIHTGADGEAEPVSIEPGTGRARLRGRLSPATSLPADCLAAARELRGDRNIEEVARGWRIPVELGTIAELDDPKFSTERGSMGYWEPASYPMETGIGIYFLEAYDPTRIPVLFVYGAAGSPQDWRIFFERIDRRKYQPWFLHYPTGRRLDETGTSLNNGVKILQSYYGFSKIHVVAHSMGGLVTRDFILKNLGEGNRYIGRYVTISTPWGGQEFAESGVKRAPSVIPSWLDMVPGSDFQEQVFDHRLRGRVDHLLMYGHRSKRSLVLPKENDGTVSVKSQTDRRAAKDAVEVIGFDEDHVSILSNDEVLRHAFRHLDGG
ncbi:lipase family alpha/beta hydrolase [Haloferula sp. A504]|uniref:lipase family alpha/beta hydrolase n=1 Tax=Haloferula sp. A504 TaxID=3373601 RepID=UPI0031CC1118|nr:alpha/beta hydrolase [Verrucomicrobiaceae bacterium E54]